MCAHQRNLKEEAIRDDDSFHFIGIAREVIFSRIGKGGQIEGMWLQPPGPYIFRDLSM
jgi:hypothetical protein